MKILWIPRFATLLAGLGLALAGRVSLPAAIYEVAQQNPQASADGPGQARRPVNI